MSISRITNTFANLAKQSKSAFIAYAMAGDPNKDEARKLILALPGAGADLVELGMPFSDPIAEGHTIQLAARRALHVQTKMKDVFALATEFRAMHPNTPLILMGYANPVHFMGWDTFAKTAAKAGVDGVIIVDLPPEESAPLSEALAKQDLALIRLIAPTTIGARLAHVLDGVCGFVYYVSVTGITGSAVPNSQNVAKALAQIRSHTNLPIAVGFGVRDVQTARNIAKIADGVVVGSAIVAAMAKGGVHAALDLTKQLAKAVQER